MFLAQYGGIYSIWVIINFGVFLTLGVFFIIIGCMYPQSKAKEINA